MHCVVQMIGQSGTGQQKTFGALARGDGARIRVDRLISVRNAGRRHRARNYSKMARIFVAFIRNIIILILVVVKVRALIGVRCN
jgi:hypothetical protein